MAISKLSSIINSSIGKNRIKEIETAKGTFNLEDKVRDIEKKLDQDGLAYVSSAMQDLRGLFGSYVKDWEYGKIEEGLGYNIKI